MTFDTKEEAYHAGWLDAADGAREMEQAMKEEAYNEGYDMGLEAGEEQRHELEVERDELLEALVDFANSHLLRIPIPSTTKSPAGRAYLKACVIIDKIKESQCPKTH
jgi:hypothetical protein